MSARSAVTTCKVACAGFYRPRPVNPGSEKENEGRKWRDWIKNERVLVRDKDEAPASEWIARLIVEHGSLPEFFAQAREAVAVPIPPSRLLDEGSLNVPLNLANALLANGLCSGVDTMLTRSKGLRSSHTAHKEGRPRNTVGDHLSSIVTTRLVPGGRYLLVDDFITTGTQMIAAANILKRANPECEVVGFSGSPKAAVAAEANEHRRNRGRRWQ